MAKTVMTYSEIRTTPTVQLGGILDCPAYFDSNTLEMVRKELERRYWKDDLKRRREAAAERCQPWGEA